MSFWDYTIVIRKVDGYYFAWLKEFGGTSCSGTGITVEEALRNLEEVFRTVYDYYEKSDRSIPEPEVPAFLKF
jgi:predicted RNase H-like HicB family nuclease